MTGVCDRPNSCAASLYSMALRSICLHFGREKQMAAYRPEQTRELGPSIDSNRTIEPTAFHLRTADASTLYC